MPAPARRRPGYCARSRAPALGATPGPPLGAARSDVLPVLSALLVASVHGFSPASLRAPPCARRAACGRVTPVMMAKATKKKGQKAPSTAKGFGLPRTDLRVDIVRVARPCVAPFLRVSCVACVRADAAMCSVPVGTGAMHARVRLLVCLSVTRARARVLLVSAYMHRNALSLARARALSLSLSLSLAPSRALSAGAMPKNIGKHELINDPDITLFMQWLKDGGAVVGACKSHNTI